MTPKTLEDLEALPGEVLTCQQIAPILGADPGTIHAQAVDAPYMIDERGITFTEADGGMWRLEARKTVAAYLKDALADEIENGCVKVML